MELIQKFIDPQQPQNNLLQHILASENVQRDMWSGLDDIADRIEAAGKGGAA